MLPVIRRTHSSNSRLRNKLLHCFLLAVVLVFSFSLLRSCAKRSSRLEDFSGGRYAETFKTDNSVLKKELLSLKGLIVGQELRSSGILARFHELHRRYAALLPAVSGEPHSFPVRSEDHSFSRLYPEWLETFRNLLGEVRRPLKGVEPQAGEFSDFQRILQQGIDGFKADSSPPLPVLKTLNVMFDYAYVMLFSDAPDVSYLESAVRSAEEVLRENRLSAEERLVLAEILKRTLSRSFPRENLIRHSLLRSLRDYEKIRLNGLRLFLGEQNPWTSVKDSVSGGRGSSLFAALRVRVRDFFYDVDRDQIQAIRMYKAFLREGASLSSRSFDLHLSNLPGRPMARREYELFRNGMRRYSDALEGLRKLLAGLDPGALPREKRRS